MLNIHTYQKEKNLNKMMLIIMFGIGEYVDKKKN